jgi:hypothetical protein
MSVVVGGNDNSLFELDESRERMMSLALHTAGIGTLDGGYEEPTIGFLIRGPARS